MDFQLDNNNNIGTVPKQKQRKHKSRKESLTLNKKKSTKKAVTPRFTPPTSELNSMEADEASEALTQDLSLHSEHDDTQEERTDSTMEGQSFRGRHTSMHFLCSSHELKVITAKQRRRDQWYQSYQKHEHMVCS